MRYSILVIVGLLISGCATAYQQKGMTGGYSETKLAVNVYRVSFGANGYSSRDRARDFALLRSAELTIQDDFKYFTVLEGQDALEYQSVKGILVSSPDITYLIKMSNDKNISGGSSYEASFILNSIGTKYELKNK
jgi:hypothetical protein